MGFIKAELDKDKSKFISFAHIVLYVQQLDSNKPSFADAAKFLLRRYVVSNEKIYHKNLADNYNLVKRSGAFREFLGLIVAFNILDYNELAYCDELVHSSGVGFDEFTNLFLSIEAVQDFLKSDCGLKQSHDLPAFICRLENKSQIQNDENNNVGTPNIQTAAPNQQNQTAKIAELQAEITRLKAELVEYHLIQKHRKRAPEFNALIETLVYYAKDYDSDTQPIKKRVKQTFNEKAKLSSENRRGEEVARILGLPE